MPKNSDRSRSRFSRRDRKSTRLNSSHLVISYAVFCLKKKKEHTRPGNRHLPERGRRSLDDLECYIHFLAPPDDIRPPLFFFFNDTATTEIYTLSLHDALPICVVFKSGTATTLQDLRVF